MDFEFQIGWTTGRLFALLVLLLPAKQLVLELLGRRHGESDRCRGIVLGSSSDDDGVGIGTGQKTRRTRRRRRVCLCREGKLPSQVWTAPPSKRSTEGCKKFQERRRETRRPTNDACDFIWQLSKRTPKYTHNAIAGKKRLGDKRSRDQVTISLIPWYTPSGPFPLTDILLTVYLTSTRQYPEVVPSLALSAPLKLQSVSFRSNPPTC